MTIVEPTSRYAQTAVKTFVLPDGREVNHFARRFLPPPESLGTLGYCTVRGGDRLDTVAARAFGDPELFWRLVDGNREILPRKLVAAVGRQLRLTAPAGFPGAFGA